jgi:hypothetical protein
MLAMLRCWHAVQMLNFTSARDDAADQQALGQLQAELYMTQVITFLKLSRMH